MKNSSYTLRKRFKNDTMEQLSKKENKLQVLYKLCKPVYVNIIKLPINKSEIKKCCEKDSFITQKKDILKNRKRKTKDYVKRINSKYNQLHHLCKSKTKTKSQNVLFSKEIKNKDKTLLIKNLSKNIKQPCIKLHKIDEVINKIAQTFAKTISTKECAINRIECMKESQTELNTFIAESVELLSINTDKNEYVKNQETENAIINPYVNKIPQSNEYSENNNNKSSDSEIIRITRKENFKKKRKNDMNDDYDNNNNNENNNIHKITLNKIKRLKRNLPEKTLEINIAHEDAKKEYIDENSMLQLGSLDVTNELFNLSDKKNLNIKENINISQQELTISNKLSTIYDSDNENNDLDQNIQEDNSNFMPLELNLVSIIENDTSVNTRNHDIMAIEKPILKDKNIQKSIQESFNSNRHFIQKYKLFKELRIFLIKFDALKNFNNKYSAKEIEKLIETYINSSTNFNISKLQKNKKSINKMSLTFKNVNVNSDESINHISNLNICETANKNICITAKEIQSIIEPLLIFSKKSSLNSINKEKVKKEENLEIQKNCHNLTKIFENKSEERFKQNRINNSEQISDLLSITKPILSSSHESINETSNLSNVFENTVNIKKSINMLDINSVTKSTNEMLCLKEEIVKTSLCKQKSISENMKVNTHIKDTTKNVLTYYSSMISPIKDKKLKDKKETKISTYKCIVCDLNFKEYSDLQSHLIIHTQKQSNTLSSMSKNINESSEKSQEIVTCFSEIEMLESPKISEQKNTEYVSKFLTSDNNKQLKKKDITKNLINKEKKKKIECINNSNECSICLQDFLTKTDLATHIYLHTENELQQAYKVAKQKSNENEKTKNKEFKQSKTKKFIDSKSSIISNTIQINEKINSKEELLCVQESDKSDKLIRENSKIKDIKFTAFKENDMQNIELPMKLDKEKINKIECTKKSFTICECHKPGINENCLQIEIVLLCHTCRVLYRSIKCFETHYRLPEYADCNQNCLNNGRSPNLFCATCNMIFNSVQDVRHHLEIHARFKKNSTMEFRCNICKVIFCGIGTLFYIHWSKHARDSLWMANEQSFPKNSIINSKLKKNSSMNLNISTEDYIQVAEYVCNNCKLPFINEDDLKEHIQKCNKSNLFKNTTTIENSNNIVQTIKVTCNLCDNTFKKNEFYKHIKSKHNFSDPQFLCISLATAKLVFICSICMVITENFYDFEDHWLTHNIIHVNFTCTHCNTKYHNSLNSFIEHAKKHKESYNILSCIVNYEKAKFICEFCNIGFKSSQNMQEHITIHKQIYFKTDQVTNHNNSALLSKKNHSSNFTATVEKQIEKTSQMKTQTIKKINKICSTKSGIDNDTEKLIKILEGNEDDSEIVIDLINQSESLNDEKRKEKEITSNNTSNILETSCINQTNIMLKNNITKSPVTSLNVQTSSHFTNLESSPNILNSRTFNSNVKYTNVLQDSNISSKKINNNDNNQLDPKIKTTDDQLIIKNIQPILQNNEPQDIVSTTKELESVLKTLLKEEEEIPPRKGFLRVKTLAELRDPIKLNKLDDHVIQNAGDSINHFKSHNILDENDKQHKIKEKDLSSKQFIDFTSNKFEKSLYEKTTQSQKNSNILPLSLSNSNYSQLNVSEIQPYNTVINNQQQQRLQTNINQNKYSSSSQEVISEVTSINHKNLPTYDIARTTTTIPHSILKSNDGSNKIVKTINVQQNVNIAHTTSSSINKNDQMSSFNNTINSNQYKCHYCDFCTDNLSNLLKHNLPGNHISCEKQYLQHSEQNKKLKELDNLQTKTRIMQNQNSSYKQFQQSNINQSGIKYTSLPTCYQYPYIATNNSDKSTPIFKQNQSIITNQSITENVSSLYYKNLNHNAGGIVMNQVVPAIQNIPTIEFIQQPTQQQIYQSQVYNEPTTIIDAQYMQQSQNLVNFSDVYQMTSNQYEVTKPNVTTYEIRYICSYCTKKFISEDLLQLHMNIFHNFVCNICNLRLYNFNDFNLHKIKHTIY
ncbi:protein PF14_0175-like [Apis dorsata]|uniref:protein PF14_0175-like n=1 Tax=Apis dorsata TaxID=7462 RepID=UPI001292F266|nr:protein PF14_0175-like [Apis dorsata]